MNRFSFPAVGVIFAVSACNLAPPPVDETPPIPPEVAAMAAPGQDLATVRLRAEDNCYWYSYAGPVETTLLPLKTIDGRPICAA